MDRVRTILYGRSKADSDEYEPLSNGLDALDDSVAPEDGDEVPFSWWEYGTFALIGVAMLWAWNMFIAGAPYFRMRFASDPALAATFQPTILTVATLTNLAVMLVLQHMQFSASYTFRINLALMISTVAFVCLAASTVMLTSASAHAYLVFVLVAVGASAWACGLIQNGAFAFSAGFGRPEYMQALMAGQSVSGVLPPVAEILSVLIVGEEGDGYGEGGGRHDGMSPASAFVYFFTAVVVSLVTMVAFAPLVRRHNLKVERLAANRMVASHASFEDAERAIRRVSSLRHLAAQLPWHAAAVFTCFVLSMFYPVFTVRITSVQMGNQGSPMASLLRPAVFTPLAFMCWNLGDLVGRMMTIFPPSMRHRPRVLFAIACARLIFIPLYLICDIDGGGALVGDLFYLLVVQAGFGATNGWLSSNCMMAAAEVVEEGEREAAGGFMGLCLTAGLATGSLLSFTATG